MKKILVLAVLVILMTSGLVFAKQQAAEETKSVITVAPVGLLYGALYVNYETMVGKSSSIRPRLGYFKFDSGYWKMQFTDIGITYCMMGKDKFDGFYWGPRIGMYNFSADYTFGVTSSGSGSTLAFGVECAKRWVTKGNFVIELGLVFEVASGISVEVAGQKSPTPTSVGFSPTFNLGIAF